MAGAALGAYSGTLLALTGALIPCGQTFNGPTCSGVAAFAGGAVGFTAGAALGAADEDQVFDRYRNGLIGLGVGAAAGYALKVVIRQYGWLDVASGAVLGGAIGASGMGALYGVGAGALVGGVLLATVPSIRVVDAAGVMMVGLAAGSMIGWALSAADAADQAAAPVSLAFRVPIG